MVCLRFFINLRMAVVIQGGSDGLIFRIFFGMQSATRELRWFVILVAWTLTSGSDSESQSVSEILFRKWS